MDYLKNIVQDCPKGQAILGLDVGKKTIGVAVSDPAQGIATPVCTIKRTKFTKDLQEIETLVREFDAGGFVLGYPVNMDGSEGAQCQSVRDFGLEMLAQIAMDLKNKEGSVWIALWDERLSTASVENFVGQTTGKKRQQAKAEGLIDRLAAQVILQGALEYMKRG